VSEGCAICSKLKTIVQSDQSINRSQNHLLHTDLFVKKCLFSYDDKRILVKWNSLSFNARSFYIGSQVLLVFGCMNLYYLMIIFYDGLITVFLSNICLQHWIIKLNTYIFIIDNLLFLMFGQDGRYRNYPTLYIGKLSFNNYFIFIN
jgi:hypothetical protein